MKRWLALFLAVVMVFSLVGCGKGGEEKPAGGEEPSGQEEPGEQVGPGGADKPSDSDIDFFDFSGEGTLFHALKELHFDFKTAEDEGYSYHQLYLDSEIIEYESEGENHQDLAKHFRITVEEGEETTVIEVWINDKGVAVKAGIDEEFEIGDAAAPYSLAYALYGLPFYVYTGIYSELIKNQDFSGYGWTIKQTTTGTKNLGFGNTKTWNYQFSATATGEIFYWEVAVVNEKKVLTRWQVQDSNGLTELVVKRIIPF